MHCFQINKDTSSFRRSPESFSDEIPAFARMTGMKEKLLCIATTSARGTALVFNSPQDFQNNGPRRVMGTRGTASIEDSTHEQ